MTSIEQTIADGVVMRNGELPIDAAAAPDAPAEPTAPRIEPTRVEENGEEIFDFTEALKPVKFRIHGEIFEAVRDLPALLAIEFGEYANQLDAGDDLKSQGEAVRKMFELVLLEESATRFIDRLQNKENPIGAVAMNSVMMWLMERYGFRPTEASDSSSGGS